MSDQAIVGSTNFIELARCLFDESNDALIIFDPGSLQLLDVNPLAQRLTKRTPKELRAMKVTDLFVSDSSVSFSEFLTSCQETRIYHSQESQRLVRRDGTHLEVNLSVSRLHTSPDPLGLVSIRDISDRKQLEADLRRTQAALTAALQEKSNRLDVTNDELKTSEQRMRELLDDVDAIVWEMLLPEFRFTFVSKQAERILGYPVALWIEQPNFWVEHLHSSDVERCFRECRDASKKKIDHVLQFRMIAADGREVWLRDIVHVVTDESGTPLKLRGVMVDITRQVLADQTRIRLDQKLRKSERQLAHVARLSTMGEMVAGISHEINQPLSAIANFANAATQILKQREEDLEAPEDPLIQWMQQISGQAIRCGDIIRRLRGFTRQGDTEESTVNLRQSISDSRQIISDLLQENAIEFEVDVGDDLWVRINEAELQQVLVNLIRNACESIVSEPASRSIIQIRAEVCENKIRLTIQDNGRGIDPESADSIFDAFMTTRKDGMGLGLGISRSIVRNHGGNLILDSEFQDGARFRIELPWVDRNHNVDIE